MRPAGSLLEELRQKKNGGHEAPRFLEYGVVG